MPNPSHLPDFFRRERRFWSPLREMSRMQRRLDRLFDDLVGESYLGMPRIGREMLASEGLEFSPACDVEETPTHFLVTFDIPGVKKDEVKIDLNGNQLIVSGERKRERKEEVQGRSSRERFYGAFSRVFTLPMNVDSEKVEATFENGVLQIAVPKSEVSVGKQIPIKEGKLIGQKAEKAA